MSEYQRPRRTREHIIASQSHNHIEKYFIDKGHTVDRPEDYGYDLVVNTFDADGYAESGDVRIQLRASDALRYNESRRSISFTITAKHYALWKSEVMPVFLILYDAQEKNAYWLYVQEYFAADSSRRPSDSGGSLTVRVPVSNLFTEDTVDLIKEYKARIMAQIAGKIKYGK